MTGPTTTVAILGGDPAVGRALGHLIEGAGHAARLLPEPLVDVTEETFSGVGLLLLAPTLSAEQREVLIDSMREICGGKELPVLDLPWPCGMEELKRAIEKALEVDLAAEA